MSDKELQAVVALEASHAFPVLLAYIADVTRVDAAECISQQDDAKLRQAQGRAQFGTNLQNKIASAREELARRTQPQAKPGGPTA